MELFKEIIICLLQKDNVNISVNGLDMNINELVELECYKALNKIREILEDEDLEDEECFIKIEEIVNVFEQMGSGCGGRHDFL